MSDPELINAVLTRIPRYNDYLLRQFMEDQIEKAPEFIEVVFQEAVKLFSGHITYNGMRAVPPEERASLELDYKRGCSVTKSELSLIEYQFCYDGQIYPILLYVPYLKNDVILIEDTKYVLPLSIKEKAFSKTASGITMKVIRQPIPFYRTNTFRLESITDEWYRNETVPTTSIWNTSSSNYGTKKSDNRRIIDATIIHYLLCKFGFLGTIARFGLTATDMVFTETVSGDTDTYRYFAAKKTKKIKTLDLFLKVKKTALENPIIAKLTASILYTLTAFQKHQLENLYDPTASLFRIMLGKIIYGHTCPEIQCKSKVDAHIPSVDTYLDPITKTRLHSYDIKVEDIYDLLQYVFIEIDRIYTSTSHTDLYNTRIDVMEELLVETIVHAIYSKWYRVDTNPKKLTKEIKSILNFPRDLISKLYKSRIVQKNPPAYGDNILVGWKIQKIRQSGLSASGKTINSPDHRFHPSIAAVETLVSFSKSNPGAGGAINPHLQIASDGSVIRQDYSDEIDVLKDLL